MIEFDEKNVDVDQFALDFAIFFYDVSTLELYEDLLNLNRRELLKVFKEQYYSKYHLKG